MRTKYLNIYRDGSHIQTVTFTKQDITTGWRVTHHEPDKYLPFSYYDTMDTMKQKLIKEQLTWEWTNEQTTRKQRRRSNVVIRDIC